MNSDNPETSTSTTATAKAGQRMTLDIGVMCDLRTPHLDSDAFGDKVSDAIRAALPGVEFAIARYPRPDPVRVTITSVHLRQGETSLITAVVERYGGGDPRRNVSDDLVWTAEYCTDEPLEPEDFARRIVHGIWEALGRDIDLSVEVLAPCYACKCETTHRGWERFYFDREDYDCFRRSASAVTTTGATP